MRRLIPQKLKRASSTSKNNNNSSNDSQKPPGEVTGTASETAPASVSLSNNKNDDSSSELPIQTAVITRVTTSPIPDRSSNTTDTITAIPYSDDPFSALLPVTRSASVGTSPLTAIPRRRSSTRIGSKPLYPAFEDIPTPQIPWNDDTLVVSQQQSPVTASSPLVAAVTVNNNNNSTSRSTTQQSQYPSGLVIQPIPKRRAQLMDEEAAAAAASRANVPVVAAVAVATTSSSAAASLLSSSNSSHHSLDNNNNSLHGSSQPTGPLFGRKSKSNPLEETEEADESTLTASVPQQPPPLPPPPRGAAGPLFGRKAASSSLDDDDDVVDHFPSLTSSSTTGRPLLIPPTTGSQLLSQVQTNMAAQAHVNMTPASMASPMLAMQESTASTTSAFVGIPIMSLDSIPSAPRRNQRETSEEEEKREISSTLSLPSSKNNDDNNEEKAPSSVCGSKARESARMLLELCSLPQVPLPLLEYLNNLLSQCEKCQEELIREISTHPESVEELFEVNDYLLNAIRKGVAIRKMHEPQPPSTTSQESATLGRTISHATASSYPSLSLSVSDATTQNHFLDARHHEPTVAKEIDEQAPVDALPDEPATPPIDVDQLVEKKDIFSLICMLRSQQQWKRLEAALALMSFARKADLVGSDENIQIRDEIRSSGGMHSLLFLFRVRGVSHELKVVVALAVAYLLPSFVGSKTPPSLGLKIMDCLRLLSNARTIEPNGEIISRNESFKAGAKGLFLFWINQVEPMLDKRLSPLELTQAESSSTVATDAFVANFRRSISASAGGGMFDQRRESIEMQELLEITVTLIVYMARDDISTTDGDGETLNTWRCTLVEQVCAVEAARPIAVREGVLRIIVEWIRSKDAEKIRTASSALSHLTSIEDRYMAGWIHSQMVNEGVLQGIVTLFQESEYGTHRDVQLAIARILSSLCVAPHTRAAVVEANGVTPLIQFLCEHRDRQDVAFYAGRALLQLAAGAITRANVFGEDDLEVLLFASPDKQDVVVQQIIDSGAINHFVDMALSDASKLRSVAVEALRVLSEDTSSRRQTRGLLCRIGAAKALGTTLKQCIYQCNDGQYQWRELKDFDADSFKDLHDAVCGLANILDPLPHPKHQRARLVSEDFHEVLIDGCKDVAESGGLESLLFIASRAQILHDGHVDLQLMNLLIECCHSLASMSPLLLSQPVAAAGYSRWAGDVLFAFYKVMKRAASVDANSSLASFIREIQVNVLRGVAALAQCEPLKVRVVDKLLPYLLQDNIIRCGGDASTYANQTFQCLDFTDDDVAVQVAGNSPQILADLFCLERSFVIQSMTIHEIRQLVANAWSFAIRETSEPTMTYLNREISDISRSDDSSACDNLFDNFTSDNDNERLRNAIIKQYRDVYAGGAPNELQRAISQGDESDGSYDSLLSRQAFPFTSGETEAQWILSHDLAMRKIEQESVNNGEIKLPNHVHQFLDWCFPSQLLQDIALPLYDLRPRAAFNFRSLLMPQRRYFSFRREGQMLSRVCAREESLLAGSQAHWILGFTNSSFSGEFSESLVQALYLCPMIRGLTFSKKSDIRGPSDSDKEVSSEEGGAILAILAGSLPPWITNVTFDGLLNDRDMRALVAILETMGKLSAAREKSPMPKQDDTQSNVYAGQGRFCFLAVRRSPNIQASSWTSFSRLLGCTQATLSESPRQPPLSSLKVLDLCGNQLGDEICASILAIAHDKDSGCSLERLDLSGNRILAGSAVLKVLRGYVDHHRYNHRTGRGQTRKGWKSPLHTLYLANNGLHLGKAWLELVTLLKHNALEFQALDLSSNGLILEAHDFEFMNVLVSALLKNTCLTHFNLSGNKFSDGAIDHVLNELSVATNDSVLGFLRFDENVPDLSAQQKSVLGSVCLKARRMLLQRFLSDRQAQREADVTESGFFNQDNEKFDDDSHLLTITEDEDTTPAAQADGDNMITVLFSAPLVYTDEGSRLCPFAKLDFSLEREHMWQCLKEASRDIELSFDTATHDRFLAAISKRCGCLHYSGHGHPDFLPFEDKGGPQWFSVQKIKNIIKRDEGASFRFVFVSACHSENAGKTFAEAGVPHVVCCRQESELKDTAAIAFTRQFYLSLAVGNTVKESFDLGCNAVRATPNLRDAEKEMEKFRLLPEDGNHHVTIFNAKPVYEWPRSLVDKSHGKGRRGKRSFHAGDSRASELSVRNMIQEDPAPTLSESFLGREVDMYHLLRLVLETRLVSVVGEAGIGRSSLVCALCHYINERASTMTDVEHIYFLVTKQGRTANRTQALVWRLLQKLVEAKKLQALPDEDSSIETMSEIVCRVLKNDKVLVVFDRVDLLEDTDEVSDFPMVLGELLRETRHVKILLTNRRALGIPSLGEKTIRVGPLTYANSIRLFTSSCPDFSTPKTQRLLRQNLIADPCEEDLLPTDPSLPDDIVRIFKLIGDGVPSRIVNAAHNISKDDYASLLSGSIRNKEGSRAEEASIATSKNDAAAEDA